MNMTIEEKEKIYEQVDAARVKGDFAEADRLRFSIPIDNRLLDFMLPVVGRDGVNKMMQEAEVTRKEKLAQIAIRQGN